MALARAPKFVVGVNGKEEPPAPHAEPVEERRPNSFACTQVVPEEPRPETTRLVVEARPVLETEKRVVVALAVEEPIANRVVLVEPLFAWTESFAHGVVEAMPIEPAVGSVNTPFEPSVTVDVAGSVPNIRFPIESWLFPASLGRKAL